MRDFFLLARLSAETKPTQYRLLRSGRLSATVAVNADSRRAGEGKGRSFYIGGTEKKERGQTKRQRLAVALRLPPNKKARQRNRATQRKSETEGSVFGKKSASAKDFFTRISSFMCFFPANERCRSSCSRRETTTTKCTKRRRTKGTEKHAVFGWVKKYKGKSCSETA